MALVLGDNIFYGQSFSRVLQNVAKRTESQPGATIFGYYVRDPREYGVVEFDQQGTAVSIVNPRLYAISSMQEIYNPCRFWNADTKSAAARSIS